MPGRRVGTRSALLTGCLAVCVALEASAAAPTTVAAAPAGSIVSDGSVNALAPT